MILKEARSFQLNDPTYVGEGSRDGGLFIRLGQSSHVKLASGIELDT